MTDTYKVKFGLSNVHIYQRQVSALNVVTYGTGVTLDGATSLTVSRSNEKVTFRADNVDYFTRYISSARTGQLTIAEIFDWFKTGYLGYKLCADGKLVETNAQGGEFAIAFQVETDVSNKKYVIYNCIATETDEEHKTTEEKDLGVQTSVLDITMQGEVVDGFVCYIKEIASFDNLALPTFPVSQ